MITEQERLSLAVYTLRKIGFRYGMYVFITGCDEMALTLGALAKHCGAASVTLGALNREDEATAEGVGFSCYTYSRDNIETAKKLTGGRLFDLVFETTGKSIAYDTFIDMIKRGGAAGILARLDESYSFFVKTAVRSQIRFVGVHSYDERSAEIAKALLKQDWRGIV